MRPISGTSSVAGRRSSRGISSSVELERDSCVADGSQVVWAIFASGSGAVQQCALRAARLCVCLEAPFLKQVADRGLVLPVREIDPPAPAGTLVSAEP